MAGLLPTPPHGSSQYTYIQHFVVYRYVCY